MSLWTELGFRSSPYATEPIAATLEGNQLLVGREPEIRKLSRSLISSGLHPTIEGDNGVGKTSLVAVTGYRLFTEFEMGRSAQAVIPLRDNFQLGKSDSAASFVQSVLYAVAGGFIQHAELLKKRGFDVPDHGAVEKWLNRPIFRAGGGGVSVLGSGGNAQYGNEPNTSQGFADAGFVSTVTGWLRECFPERASGGFLCVIDNLELLETSKAARSLLEEMRDTVLHLPGLMWTLCGARGIVRTAASTPRMEGRLTEPMDLLPVGHEDVELAVQRRIEVYRTTDTARAPVGPQAFRYMYDVLNRNLRIALKYSEDFSFWLADQGEDPAGDTDSLVQIWLTDQADFALSATKLGARAWQVFDQIADSGGAVSPGQFAEFDFQSQQAMRPQVLNLEEANLVESTLDESDKRRKTISITPRGWLVRYARSGYAMPNVSD